MDCPLCYDDLIPANVSGLGGIPKNGGVCATVCGHVFHKACVSKWIMRKYTCPACRSSASVSSLRDIFLSPNTTSPTSLRTVNEPCRKCKDTERKANELEQKMREMQAELAKCEEAWTRTLDIFRENISFQAISKPEEPKPSGMATLNNIKFTSSGIDLNKAFLQDGVSTSSLQLRRELPNYPLVRRSRRENLTRPSVKPIILNLEGCTNAADPIGQELRSVQIPQVRPQSLLNPGGKRAFQLGNRRRPAKIPSLSTIVETPAEESPDQMDYTTSTRGRKIYVKSPIQPTSEVPWHARVRRSERLMVKALVNQ